jgi:hypothetical protein
MDHYPTPGPGQLDLGDLLMLERLVAPRVEDERMLPSNDGITPIQMQPELPLQLPVTFDVCGICSATVMEVYLLRHEQYHRTVDRVRLVHEDDV